MKQEDPIREGWNPPHLGGGGSQLGPVPPGTCSPRMRGCPHGQRYRTVLPAYAGIGEAPRVRTRGAFVCPQNERPRPQAAGCLPRRPCVISPEKASASAACGGGKKRDQDGGDDSQEVLSGDN